MHIQEVRDNGVPSIYSVFNKQKPLLSPLPPVWYKYQQVATQNMLSSLHWLGWSFTSAGFPDSMLADTHTQLIAVNSATVPWPVCTHTHTHTQFKWRVLPSAFLNECLSLTKVMTKSHFPFSIHARHSSFIVLCPAELNKLHQVRVSTAWLLK